MIESVSYTNKYQNRGHQCQNLLIRCMDFRFHQQLDQLLPELFSDEGGFGDYDSPGIGGGASKAVIDEISRSVVFSAIDIAVGKHQIKRIIIVDHIDCGAYGGSGRFSLPEEEEKFHREQLAKAREIITKHYPDLEMITLYQDFTTLRAL